MTLSFPFNSCFILTFSVLFIYLTFFKVQTGKKGYTFTVPIAFFCDFTF